MNTPTPTSNSTSNRPSRRGAAQRVAAIGLALAFGAAACSSDEDPVSADEVTEEVEETTDEVAEEADEMADEEMAGDTIVDIAAANDDFTILVQAVQAAGLVDTLSGDGPFTVFAPTDAAFEAALANLGLTAEELLASEDLGSILTYHVVPGAVMAADVVGLDGQQVETVNGESVTITVDGDTVMVDGANVVTTDIEASNGVIHVIDAVILPAG
ncbi:MAG: fasciclin domain-containing protein [Acidimicrobiales bacterium]